MRLPGMEFTIVDNVRCLTNATGHALLYVERWDRETSGLFDLQPGETDWHVLGGIAWAGFDFGLGNIAAAVDSAADFLAEMELLDNF